jgi:ATP-dependent Clp protease adapter protein ClpS
MCNVRAEASDLQVIFHNDDETPKQFVIELLHTVFKQPIADAAQLNETVDNNRQAIFGTYPHDVPTNCLKRLDNASAPQVIRS